MNTSVNFDLLLKRLSELETVEQTPQVVLLRKKLPQMVKRYQRMNKIEEKLHSLIQDYLNLLEQNKENLEELNSELVTLVPDK